jgi:hypothetical protein
MADPEPTPTNLTWYVNAKGEDAQYANESAAHAAVLVGNFIGEGNPFKVPDSVVALSVLEVGADLYYRKASRNGIVGLDSVEPQPFRLNRDPMAAAYAILRPFLVVGL